MLTKIKQLKQSIKQGMGMAVVHTWPLFKVTAGSDAQAVRAVLAGAQDFGFSPAPDPNDPSTKIASRLRCGLTPENNSVSQRTLALARIHHLLVFSYRMQDASRCWPSNPML